MKKFFLCILSVVLMLVGMTSCLPKNELFASDGSYFELEEITYNGEEAYSVKLKSGVTELPEKLVLPLSLEGKQITTVAANGFRGCDGLKKLVIPIGYKYVGTDAFSGCVNLASVELANLALTDGEGSANGERVNDLIIGHSAFSDCTALTTVNFGRSVKTVGAYAFKNTRILRVELSKVAELGDYAFCDCAALTYVYIPSTLTAKGVAKLPPFYGCGEDLVIEINDNARLNGVSYELLKYGGDTQKD